MYPTRASVRRSASGASSRVIVPAVGAASDSSILMRVVLPARLGPRSANALPQGTAKVTPRSAGTPRPRPNAPVGYTFTTSSKLAAVMGESSLDERDRHAALEDALQARFQRVDAVLVRPGDHLGGGQGGGSRG